jgi:hypothetical protein
MSRNAFREAVARYWDLAYREGCEGREVDTPEGDAQSTLSEIMRLYDERSADQPDAARLKESAENFNSPGAVKACRHPVFTSWETATTGGKTCAHCGEKFDLLDLRAADQQRAVPRRCDGCMGLGPLVEMKDHPRSLGGNYWLCDECKAASDADPRAAVKPSA